MKNTGLVSVVIPFYGEPTDTLALIEQLKAQTSVDPGESPTTLEIIVSDDCSPQPFPHTEGITVVRREKNGGFGANVNSGVDRASGRWLFILNSDLSIPNNFVDRAVKQAENLGDVLFSPQVVGPHGDSQHVGRKFPTTFHLVWEWLTPFARIRHTRLWHTLVGHDTRCVSGITREVDWVMGACMVIRRETFWRVGGMDERYFMNSEEIDLQRRLRDLGIARVFAGQLTVEHVGGASSGADQQRRQWVLDSRFIYARKWKEMRRLAAWLRAATRVNYVFNRLRALRNPEVDAQATKETELSLITRAEQKD